MTTFYNIGNNELTLQIHLQPSAKTNEIVGVHEDYLKVKVKAPAVGGKANAALIKFLASKFNIITQNIVLVKGKQSRYKQVIVHNVNKLPAWLLKFTQ